MLLPPALVLAAADAAATATAAPPPDLGEIPEAVGRRLVYARSTGLCERCGREWATDWHHRKNRTQGGLWCPSNGLHLGRACHDDIGRHPAVSYVAGFLVREHAIPANQPVRLALHGWALLNTDGTVHLLTDRGIL